MNLKNKRCIYLRKKKNFLKMAMMTMRQKTFYNMIINH